MLTVRLEASAPRAERARVADPRTPAAKSPPASVPRTPVTPSVGVAVSARDAQGRTFQGTQLGSEEFQSKSYTERKHLEEHAFKKALKVPDPAATKPREPSLKEREQEIVAAAGSAMFDLSLLTEHPDEEELHEKRRIYEDALQHVHVHAHVASPRLQTGPVEAEGARVRGVHAALRAALEGMAVKRVDEALVEDFPPLP